MFAAYLDTLAPALERSRPRVRRRAAAPPTSPAEPAGARPRRDADGAVEPAGRLLLTTGNKSEVATGYCTLYGDMAGGLAVISDVPKTLVYRLSRAVNASAGRESSRVDADKPPSAELRPNQTDQDSLPPYDVLDAILEAHLVGGLDAAGLVARGFDPRGRRATSFAGAQQRIQAPPDAAGPEDHRQGVRPGPPLPDRSSFGVTAR